MSGPWNRFQKVIESGTIRYIEYGFLLVFCSNVVPKMPRFEIFDFKNAVTLKTGLGVTGHCRGQGHHAIVRIRLPIYVL